MIFYWSGVGLVVVLIEFLNLKTAPTQIPALLQKTSQAATWFKNTYGSNSNSSFSSYKITKNMEKLISNLPACPVQDKNLPYCARTACSPENLSKQESLDSNLYACLKEIGCCFDLELYLYKKTFGSQTKVPTCYSAVSSKIYLEGPWELTAWDPNNIKSYTSRFKTLNEIQETKWAEKNQCPHAEAVKHLNTYLQRYLSTIFYNDEILNYFRTITKSSEMIKIANSVIDILSPSCGPNENIDSLNCHLLNCCHVSYVNFRNQSVNRCVKSIHAGFWSSDAAFVRGFEVQIFEVAAHNSISRRAADLKNCNQNPLF